MTRLRRLTDARKLLLIEDAAQAIGATWMGRPAGSLGDAAAFSFYPTKNLGALGQAGAVTTSDADLARRVRQLRQHGQVVPNQHLFWGFNERMDNLQAAFLRVKLDCLDADQRLRDQAVARYQRNLDGADGVTMMTVDQHARHVHHLFVVKVRDRDAVRMALGDFGIETGVHYPTPIHRQPAAEGLTQSGSLAAAERLAERILSLPLYARIPDAHVNWSARSLRAVLASRQERER